MGLEFLNENSGAFVVIFSAVVAIATIVYAILTWRLVSETRKMRFEHWQPFSTHLHSVFIQLPISLKAFRFLHFIFLLSKP